MIEFWRRVVIGSGIAVYLVGGIALGGMLVDRRRVDHPRADRREQRGEAIRAWQQVLIEADGPGVRAISRIEVER